MASFTGELQDFHDIVGPKIRNDIASMTKKKKSELKYICQHCNQKNELDSAHRHERSQKDIIKNVLENYKTEDGKYVVQNLHQLIKEVKQAHIPIEDSFLFLCQKCHRKYDNDYKNNQTVTNQDINRQDKSTTRRLSKNIKSDYEEVFIELISSNSNLKDCLKELFVKFPDMTITSTHLRKIWESQFPNENSQKVTDYLWHLEKEGVLIKTSRSNYKSSNEIKNNLERHREPVKKVSKIRNVINKFKKETSPSNNMINQTLIPKKGEEFTERELYEQFQVRNSGGIRPSRKNKVIILIDSYFSEKQGGYKDKISGNSEFVHYVGEGEGDQKMMRGNKSILESKYNGYTLLYFEKPEPNRLCYKFQVKYDSWEQDRQSNSLGRNRRVIIFTLKIID